MPQLKRFRKFGMELAKQRKLPKSSDAPPMIIIRNLLSTRFRPAVKGGQDLLDISFEVIETEFLFPLMDGRRMQCPGCTKNERASFTILTVHLAEFVELQVSISAILIPPDRLENSGNERCSQDGLVFVHRIPQFDRGDVRSESALHLFVAERVRADFRVPESRKYIAQPTFFRLAGKRGAGAGP